VYAVVKEVSMKNSHTICAITVRETVVFESTTNVIEVRLGGRKQLRGGQGAAASTTIAHFLLQFEGMEQWEYFTV